MSVVAELTIFPLNDSVEIDDFHIEVKKELERLNVENTLTDTGITIKTNELSELFYCVNSVYELQKNKYKQYHVCLNIFIQNTLKNLTLGASYMKSKDFRR
jgi:uncharacterized protein YqgV (UPF0045/DUF77 family)